MENEQLFEVGETYAFKSDLFESPIKENRKSMK